MNRSILTTLVLAIIGMSLAPTLRAKELDPNDHKSIHYCYLLKKRYAFAVSDAAYENMTKWNIESDDPPPVSPQKAFKLAKARLDKIEIPKGYFWTFEGATLQPVNQFFQDGKWIWKVSFRYTINGPSTGAWPTMDFLVTMDGELIEPLITEWER